MKLLADGGMRHISWLGLRSARFYPPAPARTRTVLVPSGIASWDFPRMVFLVVRVGVLRRLHAFEVDDAVKTIGPATKLYPLIGNSLSMDGWVCLGDTGLGRDPVGRYWNTVFTLMHGMSGNAIYVWQFEKAGRIDHGEVLKQLVFLVFGGGFVSALFFITKLVLS